MKLVSVARRRGRDLNLARVYPSPRLCDIAESWAMSQRARDAELEKQWPPFSLLDSPSREDFLVRHVCEPHGIARTNIKDAYPLHDNQKITIENNKWVFAHFRIDESLDLDHIIDSWIQVVRQHDILRTVLVSNGQSFFAAVLHSFDWKIERLTGAGEAGVKEIVREDGTTRPQPGTPLGKVMVIQDVERQVVTVVVKMSHIIWDGYCLALFWEDWKSAYETGIVPFRLQFQDILCSRKFIQDRDQSVRYWENLLADALILDLPIDASGSTGLSAQLEQHKLERTRDGIVAPPGMILDSLIKAAWAVTLAVITGQADIIFFQISSGRRLGGAKMENAAGPLLGIFPLRVTLNSEWRADELCRFLQDQDTHSIPHEIIDVDELWEMTDWEDDAPFSMVDHVKGGIESYLTLDGVDFGRCFSGTGNYLRG
ncbi:hypothetical protein NUU61_005833 [Penicillium alfredii]|uniref:Condensation domain-containing protein n=1 Tax=Penicillium alfredii TaxID=1506179 RepID=A0A9W9FA61_9EURO|nr:uncharacterized protein NUU61_005833 [Penicillium alfredii]KAJ5096477.1 hypothetical protein NUU61_005833 [Penicillium alfredii]